MKLARNEKVSNGSESPKNVLIDKYWSGRKRRGLVQIAVGPSLNQTGAQSPALLGLLVAQSLGLAGWPPSPPKRTLVARGRPSLRARQVERVAAPRTRPDRLRRAHLVRADRARVGAAREAPRERLHEIHVGGRRGGGRAAGGRVVFTIAAAAGAASSGGAADGRATRAGGHGTNIVVVVVIVNTAATTM